MTDALIGHSANERTTGPGARPLRVAMLIDSYMQPAWVATLIEDVATSGFASIVLVVRNTSPTLAPGPRLTLGQRMRNWVRNRHNLLYVFYERLDAWKFAVSNDPLRMVDVEPHLRGIPVIDVAPRETKFSDYFADETVDWIRTYDLDVAVRLGFRILRGKALQIARYGVWSYHHGDNLVNRGGPPGFWEVMENAPVTGSVLQILSEELDAGRVIYRSWASTEGLSVGKNRAGYFWKSSSFILRKLRDVHADGAEALRDPDPLADEPRAYSRRLYVAPRNRELAPYLLRLAGRYVRAQFRSWTEVKQWFLAYRMTPKGCSGHVPDLVPFRFRTIVPPLDRFWADPFPARVGERHFLLFEELVYAEGKGRICAIEVDEKGAVGQPVNVLERDYHLSYPFWFEWRGEHYLIPETAGNRTVELYRAVDFPFKWELDRVLLSDVALVDATVAEIEGRWWMFAGSITRGGSRCDELNIYYADSPLGPWRPHRRNPVVSDVRRARPAGRLFERDGRWYRPAQDCSASYGYAINIQRITRLDPDHFEEVTVSSLRPEWADRLVATHTVNAIDGCTAIDGQWRRRKAWVPW